MILTAQSAFTIFMLAAEQHAATWPLLALARLCLLESSLVCLIDKPENPRTNRPIQVSSRLVAL